MGGGRGEGKNMIDISVIVDYFRHKKKIEILRELRGKSKIVAFLIFEGSANKKSLFLLKLWKNR